MQDPVLEKDYNIVFSIALGILLVTIFSKLIQKPRIIYIKKQK